MFLQQGGDFGKIAQLGTLDILRDQSGGDVDAVEDIADVMEDVGGDFRHARHAGGFQQFPLGAFHFLLHSSAFFDLQFE